MQETLIEERIADLELAIVDDTADWPPFRLSKGTHRAGRAGGCAMDPSAARAGWGNR
jgi:hypothetical protein